LSGRGLCDELITRPEESYRLRCVVVCDLETSRMGAPYIYGISHLRVKIGTKNITDYIILFVMPEEEIFLHHQTFHKLNIYSILHYSCKVKFGTSPLVSWKKLVFFCCEKC